VIRELTEADVPAAAALLVARHAEHRQHSPLLAPLDQARAEGEVQGLLAVEGAQGWVAEEQGQVVGYLLASEHLPQWHGRNGYVQAAGFAGVRLPELYAEAARGWADQGRRAHLVVCPAYQVEPWFHLGFGVQHVHAAMQSVALAPDPRVRRAGRADIPVLAHLDTVLDDTLRASPVFSPVQGSTQLEAAAEWEGAFDEHTVFVAEVDGTVLGCAVALDLTGSSTNIGVMRPERAGFLGFAAVLPHARGLGLGRALGNAATTWAAEQGYPVVCADWRSANLEAARTWTALGYDETFVRLHRQLAG
jgi:ribosomal protein S18 acetylase RimI-like enzyme